jgi:hypothetical protein
VVDQEPADLRGTDDSGEKVIAGAKRSTRVVARAARIDPLPATISDRRHEMSRPGAAWV